MSDRKLKSIITLDEIDLFLRRLNVPFEYIKKDKVSGFSRTIQFEVNNQIYIISWFNNQSTLFIGSDTNVAPQIPFRHMYFDRTFPHVNGNKCIGFTQFAWEKEGVFDREHPYEAFRIPLEID